MFAGAGDPSGGERGGARCDRHEQEPISQRSLSVQVHEESRR